MFIEERHREILNTISEKGRISIGEIQEKYGVSVDSARRDLRLLEERGLLKRTHGGAIPAVQVGQLPPRFRDMKNIEPRINYLEIAKIGASFVRPNDIVYLTSGSVGFLALRYLPRDIPYTLVVNSIPLADELKYWDNITVYVTGGKMRMHGTASMVDSLAASFVRNLHFDLSLITGAGVDAGFGMSNGTAETAEFQRVVIENTRHNVLLMPSAKIGFQAFIKVCGANKFQTLITDWDADDEAVASLRDLGLDVIVAENPEKEEEKPCQCQPISSQPLES